MIDRDERELIERAERLVRRHEQALAEAAAQVPDEGAAENVAAGWLGIEVPEAPRQRSRSRASHRKTARRRPGPEDDERRRLEESWFLPPQPKADA